MKHRRGIIRRTAVRALLGGVLVAGLAAGGCAYFNTLYNAKVRYQEAERQPRDREGNATRTAELLYDEVIEKCRKMIQTWPDSRHVDDARLLIGQSYFGSDRFEAAVATIDTLIMLHPDSELVPRALALKGTALARSGEHEEAIEVLEQRLNRFGSTAQVLFDLSSSAMSIDRSDDAVRYLSALEEEYPGEPETFDARVAIAEILAEKGQYEESKAVYQRLAAQRIPESFRYRVWMGSAAVNLELKRYAEALATLELVDVLVLTPEEEPPMLLLRATALAGADSADGAIKTFTDVTQRFSRGEFAAEAHYNLGTIYEGRDSLETARKHYESVAQAYANSEYARESIRRGNNLSQLMKLREAADDNSPEALALRQFALAELQLFQFDNAEEALAAYQQILVDYPDTDFAPKAAYAVGYIYGRVMVDSTRAWESYRYLLERYPGSQQAAYADQIVATVGGAPAGPRTWTEPSGVEASSDTTRVAPAPSDTTRATQAPGDTTRATQAPSDTTRATQAPGDTTRATQAPSDTTRVAPAPSDTTRTEAETNEEKE